MSINTNNMPEDVVDPIKDYVTSTDDNIYAVKNLHGIVGAAFARYSRAPEGLREVLRKEFVQNGMMDPSKADKLIDRVLIEYGDDSVGELEGAHVCFEKISNLVTKFIEDRRIGGSPIEKSSRYVPYNTRDENGEWKYIIPPEVERNHDDKDYYCKSMNRLFELYAELFLKVNDQLIATKPINEARYAIRKDHPPISLAEASEDEKELKAFHFTYRKDIMTKTCDLCRGLLPTATATNVGVYGNGRFFQNLLTQMYSDSLEEIQSVAGQAHRALNQVIPRYVARAKRTETSRELEKALDKVLVKLGVPQRLSERSGLITEEQANIELVCLLEDPPVHKMASAEERALLAEAIFPVSDQPLKVIRRICNGVRHEAVDDAYTTLAQIRETRRDKLARGFEGRYPITVEFITDWGTYRDLERHRMMTQQRQLITPDLGFLCSDELYRWGLDSIVQEAHDISIDLYRMLSGKFGAKLAQYAVLFGHRMRWYAGMNWREAAHLIELRTGPQGHPGYRKVCQQLFLALKNRSLNLSRLLKFTNLEDVFWSRADSEAKQRLKEAKLDES